MDLQVAGLFVAILSLLAAILAAAFAFREIQRWDQSRRKDLKRREDDDIIEWARVNETRRNR